MDLEFVGTLIFFIDALAKEAWVILIVQTVVRIRVNLLFIKLLISATLLAEIVPSIIVASVVVATAFASISVAIAAILIKRGLAAAIAAAIAIVIVRSALVVVVPAATASFASILILAFVMNAVAAPIGLLASPEEVTVRPIVIVSLLVVFGGRPASARARLIALLSLACIPVFTAVSCSGFLANITFRRLFYGFGVAMLAESNAIVIFLIVIVVIVRVEFWHSRSLSDELMGRVV